MSNVNHGCSLNRGLLVWWMGRPENTGGATYKDLLGVHDGTLVDMDPTWIGGSRPGGHSAIDFAGGATTDHIETQFKPDFGTGGYTFGFWMKTTTSDTVVVPLGMLNLGGTSIIAVYLNSNEGLTAQAGETALQIRDEDNKGQNHAIAESQMYDGRWHHYLFTKVGNAVSSMIPYVDGERKFRYFGVNNAFSGDIKCDYGISFGARNLRGVWDKEAECSMDDIRCWDRELTVGEIFNVYKDAKTGYKKTLKQRRKVRVLPAAAPPVGGGRIMSTLVNSGGLVGVGGIAGQGGGLVG